MVVDDLDFRRTLLGPYEAITGLIVDADRILTLTVAAQLFEPIAWRNAKVGEIYFSAVAIRSATYLYCA
jgi:hypothetical protein